MALSAVRGGCRSAKPCALPVLASSSGANVGHRLTTASSVLGSWGRGMASGTPGAHSGSPSSASATEHVDPATQRWRRRKNPVITPKMWSVPPVVKVPSHIPRPSFADHPQGRPRELGDEEYGEVKSASAIDRMRAASKLAAEALATGCEAAREGVTTAEVDRIVCEFIIQHGGYPVGINYFGFPRGCCASPNEVALHGVPNTRPLESGDIVNFDVVAFYDGAYGDNSRMVCVGDVDDEARRLVQTTKDCLDKTIEMIGPGVKLNKIGEFCSSYAKAHGFSAVAEYCGHFIGSELHMKPNVLHVPNLNQLELRPGNTFTIEPIFIEGNSAELDQPLDDGWTILSKSGGWSAQWEHTVLVTEHGAEALTFLG